MSKQGFEVTRHHLLPTAWLAKYTHGKGGRTIGVNSEMDALPGVGHACGHNLIAISGVAVACAVKAVLVKWNIDGAVSLLGTPGQGFVFLLLGRDTHFNPVRRGRWRRESFPTREGRL